MQCYSFSEHLGEDFDGYHPKIKLILHLFMLTSYQHKRQPNESPNNITCTSTAHNVMFMLVYLFINVGLHVFMVCPSRFVAASYLIVNGITKGFVH